MRAAPTGAVARRAWYLYEILTGRTLDIEDAPIAAAVDLLDPEAYFTGKPKLSTRHRVRDNLLGTGQFCPMIRRTPALTEFVRLDLAAEARKIVGHTGAHVVARAASFLLLADSRASFEIEGERPPRNRLERWGRAVMQAGKNPLTLDEILRLQRVLIEDARFVRPGLRPDGVFLGERDHFGDPLPEFIGARPDNLASLMAGLIEANDRMRADGIDRRTEGSGICLRVCLHSSLPGRQWPDASLPDPSCAGGAEVHAAGDGLPGFVRHAGSHRRLSRRATGAFRSADALH